VSALSASRLAGGFLVLISVRGLVDPSATMRLDRLGEFRTLMAISSIEPVTTWPVAQYINQLRAAYDIL
jgi:hypothetical protein